MNSLYRWVGDGRLRITLLLAPPRSISTGIAIALAQSPDVDLYIHEPFANDYKGVPSAADGSALIVERVKDVMRTRDVTRRHPVRIVIKECSTHVRPLHFRSLSRYSDAVVVMVRSPLMQLWSIARICKWIWSKCPQPFPFHIRDLTTADIKRYARHGDLETYFVAGWKALARHVSLLGERSWLAVDTELVRAMPHRFLKHIASRAHVRFTERMISGWRKDHLVNIDNDEWARKAAHAGKLHRPVRRPPQFGDFPEAWHPHINEALAAYASILATPQFQNCIRGLLAPRGAFAHVAPDTRYALAATARAQHRGTSSDHLAIRRRNPEYSVIFDALDAGLGE